MTLIKKRILVKIISISEGGQYEIAQCKIPASAYRVTGIGFTTRPSDQSLSTNIRYYGVGLAGENTEGFVLTLVHEFQDQQEDFFTVNPGANEKIYYAQRKALGLPNFQVDTFIGGFLDPSTVTVTDPISGIIEDYYLWESTNVNLGLTTVTVNQP